MWAAAADGARTPEAEVAARAWDRTRQLEQVSHCWDSSPYPWLLYT